jgi:DNA-binding NarL/FixJ family response regulator
MNVRVFLVDDHQMVIQGLRHVIAQQPNLTIVGEAPTGAAALKLAPGLAPDLIVMDLHLPDMNGIEVTRRMSSILPLVKVVIFSGDAARSNVDAALEAGARGYLWKQSATEDLIQAIQMVMAGNIFLSHEVNADILEEYQKGIGAEGQPPRRLLTQRDRQLMRFIVAGRRNKEIAAELTVTPKAVEAYRSRLMKKLGCSNSADLIRYAIREGIAPT